MSCDVVQGPTAGRRQWGSNLWCVASVVRMDSLLSAGEGKVGRQGPNHEGGMGTAEGGPAWQMVPTHTAGGH